MSNAGLHNLHDILRLINRKIEREVVSRANRVRNLTLIDVERVGKWLKPLNSFTSNLARTISANVNHTSIHFHTILDQVAPSLFLTLSTVPILNQASFIDADGLHFSVYYHERETLALASSSANCWRQPVNRDTGKLYGQPVSASPVTAVNSSALNSTLRNNGGYSSIGSSLEREKEYVFLHTVAVDGRGWISLGFLTQTAIGNYRTGTRVLAFMFAVVFASIVIYTGLMIRGVNRETCLCDALLKQTEATHQAERKSMNKSIAFAMARHDVRGSLASITGLVELCQADAPPCNKLSSYLQQMSNCASDLPGIMNSVLDTNKIEAGKMQLDEVEFNLADLLDEVLDTFYPLGTKKGIDVMLDLSDASVYGLQLILNNLLSNAVKFTFEGHISIRVIAKKINSENAIIADNRNSFLKKLLSWMHCQSKDLNSLDTVPTIKNASDCMEFVFEVQDTGKGIPKHMKSCIFENYVQVKETALAQEGIGLGLGIVQSLVRLMGGEIRIVDKMDCQKGTCFEFNIFLGVNDHVRSNDDKDGSSFIIIYERRKIAKRMFESQGIKVSCLKYGSDLGQVLERIKHEAELVNISSSRSRKEACLQSSSSDSEPDNKGRFSHDRKPCLENSSTFMLIVIDAAAGACIEFSSVVHNFRNNVSNFCVKVVWWENPMTRYPIFRFEEEYPSDNEKPLRGKRFLVVDDDDCIRKITSAFITRLFGAQVDACKNGIEAYERICDSLRTHYDQIVDGHISSEVFIRSLLYDCIIMDCQMPEMDGYEATKRICEEEKNYGVYIPIIAVTGETFSNDGGKICEA
uniref:histidine kinase n=1 Tax=Kalanchoe fedtschenkoi TaxID=63787 RepID=A0A7N1A9Y7_KALFE